MIMNPDQRGDLIINESQARASSFLKFIKHWKGVQIDHVHGQTREAPIQTIETQWIGYSATRAYMHASKRGGDALVEMS